MTPNASPRRAGGAQDPVSFMPTGYTPARKTPVRKRSGMAPANPSTVRANTPVQAAASVALPAINRCGLIRSARFNTVEVTAPATKPSCTDAVSQTDAAALICHDSRSAGTTAEAENHTARPSTWTAAISARCMPGRDVISAPPLATGDQLGAWTQGRATAPSGRRG